MQLPGLARRSLLLLGILFTGCTVNPNGDEEEGPPATGDWSGGFTGITLELSLVEHEGGNITGTGTVRGVSGMRIVAVEQGVHRHPNITVVLGAIGAMPLTLSGKFDDDDQIRGSANGSGFNAEPFTLVRR